MKWLSNATERLNKWKHLVWQENDTSKKFKGMAIKLKQNLPSLIVMSSIIKPMSWFKKINTVNIYIKSTFSD